ncbi:MAG: COG1361 S-layer family protein [Candidatus Binatia bacterium]
MAERYRRAGIAVALVTLIHLGLVAPCAAAGGVAIANGVSIQPFAGWSVAPQRFGNAQELEKIPSSGRAPLTAGIPVAPPHVTITTEQRLDHADGLQRLKQIDAEWPTPSTFLSICGWPALQRRQLAPVPQRGESETSNTDMILRLTTAVAVDSLLVRIEGAVPPDAPAAAADDVEALARGLTCPTRTDPTQTDQEINNLRTSPSLRTSLLPGAQRNGAAMSTLLASAAERIGNQLSSARDLLTPPAAQASSPGAAQRVIGSDSEMEIAVSPNGQYVVVAAQNHYRTSNDGGLTFPFSGSIPVGNFGDSSMAWGQSGTFYYGFIHNTAGCGNFGCATGILASTDNGQTFPFLSDAVTCPNSGGSECFPDQEHIAADRVNAAAGGKDQVYSTWRNFVSGSPNEQPAIVCSTDSGATWTAPLAVGSAGDDVPRITVGQNGFVYVVYRAGGNVMLMKYTQCQAPFAAVGGFPVVISAVTDVSCPVPGLDRCNDGNILSSHMVAVDDTNAAHLYAAFATHTGAGNEDVVALDSTDAGATWGGPVNLNSGVTGRRYMPWVCALSGGARVTWYDRRAAVLGVTNDLTDFYCGSASRSGGSLVAGAEAPITSSSDPECAAGKTPGSAASWPCNSRATGDSESCTVQPQLAGRCCTSVDSNGNCIGTGTRCDYSDGCSGGETCFGGGGCPKYGDYNGNACAAGRVFTVWASAVPPAGITASGNIDVFLDSKFDTTGPDLTISKVDANAPNPVVAGTNLTYSLLVTNNGPATALSTTVTDTIPANTTFFSITATGFVCSTPSVGGTGTISCTRAFMAVAESDPITIKVHVDASTLAGTTISNTATVANADDPNPGNNSATATTNVIASADLAATKDNSPIPVLASSNITYTFGISNAGPSDAQDVHLSDALPPGTTFVSLVQNTGPTFSCTAPAVGGTGTMDCSIATLALNASASFTAVVRVCPDVPCTSTISNTATASSSTSDPNPANNSATATTTAQSQADVAITKIGVPPAQFPGLLFTYTVTVTDNGPSNSANTIVVDTLPPGFTAETATPSQGSCLGVGTGTVTCNLGTVGTAGECGSVPLTATVTITTRVPLRHVPGPVTNNATVSTGDCLADPNLTNNVSSATSTVLAFPVPLLSPIGVIVQILILFAVGAWMRYRSRVGRE